MVKKIIALAGLAICIADAGAQDTWDLRRCVDYAWQNNISVKQQEVQASLTGLSEKQARLSAYPNANFNTNTGIQLGRSVDPTTNQFTTTQLLFQGFNLNADVVVFNWHRVKNNLLAAGYDTKAAQANVEKTKNDIALMIATQYLQALLNKEQIGLAKIQFGQTQNQLEATRKRVMAGALPELSAAELEAQLARDSASIINAEAASALSLLQLKAVLNLDAAAPFDIAVPPVDKIPVDPIGELQPDYVYQLALKNQPAQKVNELRLLSSKANVQVARSSLYPTISAFAGLGTNFASSFKTIKGVNFNGYGTPDPTLGAVTIGGVDYFFREPQFAFTQGKKSFGDLWKGYGRQIDNNLRQNIGISVSVPIFNAGSARIGYERSKLNVKSAELVITQADQQLKQDIYQAYTNAMSALQRFHATEVTLATAGKTYDYARKRFDAGLLSAFELITNQNNATRARLDMLLAKYEYVFRMKVLEFYKGQGLKL